MIDAKTAREIAEKFIGTRANSQIMEIEAGIQKEAKKGNFFYQADYYLLKQVEIYLKQLGYTIEMYSGLNEPYTIIRWDEKC